MRRFRSSGFSLCSLMLAILCCFALSACAPTGAHAAPTTSCVLDIGAAQTSPNIGSLLDSSVAHSLMAQVKLAIVGRDCGLTLGCRNAFYSSSGVYGKSNLTGELTYRLTSNAKVFVSYEDDYRSHVTWGWAGVRLNIFRL